MDNENLDYEHVLRSFEENLISRAETINNDISNWNENMINQIKQMKYAAQLSRNSEESIIQEHNQSVASPNVDVHELEHQVLHLKQLQNKETELKQDILNMEVKLNNLKKSELDKIDAQQKVLQEYRDLCKASKELTRTVFNYQSSNVTGVIISQNESNQIFKLNPKKLSADDITKHLWKYMALAAEEDWTSLVLKK